MQRRDEWLLFQAVISEGLLPRHPIVNGSVRCLLCKDNKLFRDCQIRRENNSSALQRGEADRRTKKKVKRPDYSGTWARECGRSSNGKDEAHKGRMAEAKGQM